MYREEKTIEAAAYFLRKSKDWSMDSYDLIKLLYLADREQVRSAGRTITGDHHWSLPWGPALGNVLDAIRNEGGTEWTDHIRTDRRLKKATLVADAPPAELSRADLKSLDAVWDEFGAMNGSALMAYAQRLPEYTDTEGRVPISLEDLARAVGRTEDEIDTILADDRERDAVERFKASLGKAPAHV